ncbi:hypothetical protein JFV29_15410 [Peribacillus sp. TH16]|nr:hypothetical protein [Peribacillus sp. TH16]MBK5483241.1 hypothetical protein [Peribacillus sp. TH16]
MKKIEVGQKLRVLSSKSVTALFFYIGRKFRPDFGVLIDCFVFLLAEA